MKTMNDVLQARADAWLKISTYASVASMCPRDQRDIHVDLLLAEIEKQKKIIERVIDAIPEKD